MSGRRTRSVIVVVLAVVPLVAVTAAAVAFGPRLGPVMASHWSGDLSRPDGYSSTWGSFALLAGIIALVVAAGVVTALLAARERASRAWPALSVLTAGFLAAAWIASAWATADAPRPSEADLGPRLAVLLGAVVCAVPVSLLLPARTPTARSEAARPLPDVTADERIAWTGRASSGVLGVVVGILAVLFVVAVVVAAVSGSAAAWFVAVVLLVVGVASLALVPVRLTIDRRGIRLASVALRVPLVRIRIEDVAAVRTGTIEPMQWGGWGYRITGAGVAYVAGRGPGIIITRRSGSSVAISIPRPEQAAAVADALAGRSRAS